MSGSTTAALEAHGITVRFGASQVLTEVDLSVESGSIHGLVGPNGSGKTTLLNVLSGFVRQAAGTVIADGKAVKRGVPRLSAKRGIGRTFQSVRLFPRLSVRENIELGALASGKRPVQATSKATDLINRFGLEPVAELEADSVPYGTERLISVARALAGEPYVLLLDEPCAGLDESETDDLLAILQKVNSEFGCAIVVVEHDMKFIAGLCSTVQVLANGQTIAVGTPTEALSDQTVIDAYLGS